MNIPGPPFQDPLPTMGTMPHTVHVQDTGTPRKWLECQDCSYTALWDGRNLLVLLDGDPRFGHGGSW